MSVLCGFIASKKKRVINNSTKLVKPPVLPLFKPFLDKHTKNGWVNIDLKKSQSGKYYGEINTWQPKQESKASESSQASNDLPF